MQLLLPILILLHIARAIPNGFQEAFQLEDPLVVEGSADQEVFAPSQFEHPGVFLSRPQLDFIKEQVNAGHDPWYKAYRSMMSHQLAGLSRTANPVSSVDCGSRSQNPSHGCYAERQDAIASYIMSLAYYITEDTKYAEKAISYMNAWAKTITRHTASNAPLQTGWSAASWARAGEIIKHTYDGWSSSDLSRFETLLKKVYLPYVVNGDDRTGNWDLVMLEAAIGISIFLDDKSSYDKAMNIFRGRVPAYIYLRKDGSYPKAAPGSPQDVSNNRRSKIVRFWYNQSSFRANGIAQETCRDFIHTGYGLASISHIAETALIQGTDFYKTEIGERLRHGLGFHSKYQLGTTKPSWLCPGENLVLNMEYE